MKIQLRRIYARSLGELSRRLNRKIKLWNGIKQYIDEAIPIGFSRKRGTLFEVLLLEEE